VPWVKHQVKLFFDFFGQPGFGPGSLVFMYDPFACGFIQNRGDFLKLFGFLISGFFGIEVLNGAPDKRFYTAVSLSGFFRRFDSFLSRFVCWQLKLLKVKLKSNLKYKKPNYLVN
jgi:hypothetical protein